MPSSPRNPQDLLAYNSAYRVLICRKCQYAIQKNAISSHLLRHKIYREERQRLLSYVAELDILDPEDVISPPPGSQAIPGLSVIPGYCCIRPGCDSLCASIKRMKRHQSQDHKETDLVNIAAYARPVMLQTFFRGTKLKYVEVSDGGMRGDRAVMSNEASFENDEDADVQDIEDEVPSIGNASSGMSDRSLSQRTTSPLESAQDSEHVANLNLEAMAYFRHYLTTTSASLPAPYDAPQYWSTTVVDHSLKHQWLMHGLLALAAYNLAKNSIDADLKETHALYGRQYLLEFSNGFSLELVRQQILHGTDMSTIGNRIHHLLKCAISAIGHSAPDIDRINGQHPSLGIAPLVEILGDIAQWSFLPPPGLSDQQLIFSRAKTILDFNEEDIPNLDPTYFRLLNCLGSLPAQLATALGRPDRVQEVLATLAATSSLVVCCEISFASDSREAVWHGMVGWLVMLPQQFHDMVKTDSAAALVLLAYWSALVSRAETMGFWFMNGLAERVIREVDERLEDNQSGLRRLVQDFKAGFA